MADLQPSILPSAASNSTEGPWSGLESNIGKQLAQAYATNIFLVGKEDLWTWLLWWL
jgi:hypothetical protein